MERIAQHATEVIMTGTAKNPATSKRSVLVMGDVQRQGNAYAWMDGGDKTVQSAMIPFLAQNVRLGVTRTAHAPGMVGVLPVACAIASPRGLENLALPAWKGSTVIFVVKHVQRIHALVMDDVMESTTAANV
jgi:hypothetical protein